MSLGLLQVSPWEIEVDLEEELRLAMEAEQRALEAEMQEREEQRQRERQARLVLKREREAAAQEAHEAELRAKAEQRRARSEAAKKQKAAAWQQEQMQWEQEEDRRAQAEAVRHERARQARERTKVDAAWQEGELERLAWEDAIRQVEGSAAPSGGKRRQQGGYSDSEEDEGLAVAQAKVRAMQRAQQRTLEELKRKHPAAGGVAAAGRGAGRSQPKHRQQQQQQWQPPLGSGQPLDATAAAEAAMHWAASADVHFTDFEADAGLALQQLSAGVAYAAPQQQQQQIPQYMVAEVGQGMAPHVYLPQPAGVEMSLQGMESLPSYTFNVAGSSQVVDFGSHGSAHCAAAHMAPLGLHAVGTMLPVVDESGREIGFMDANQAGMMLASGGDLHPLLQQRDLTPAMGPQPTYCEPSPQWQQEPQLQQFMGNTLPAGRPLLPPHQSRSPSTQPPPPPALAAGARQGGGGRPPSTSAAGARPMIGLAYLSRDELTSRLGAFQVVTKGAPMGSAPPALTMRVGNQEIDLYQVMPLWVRHRGV